MKPYRILVTGSRDWLDGLLVRGTLAEISAQHPGPVVIVHGGCPTGADMHAAFWVDEMKPLDVLAESIPADWDHCTDSCPQGHRKMKRPGDAVHPGVCSDYCPSAGPRRNWEMVRRGADVCVAFIRNGSRGASHCADLAEKAGIPVRRFTA